MTARRRPSNPEARTLKFARLPGGTVVRLPRIVEARRRIDSGWYDRAEVRHSLVEAVMQEIRQG